MSTINAAMFPTRCGLCGGWVRRGEPIGVVTLIADALTIAVYGVATVLLLAGLDKHPADGHQGIAGTPTPPP
jgi:hypothetical protein